jgi:hypothetical protein
MIRIFCFLAALMLWTPAQKLWAQAQTNVPSPAQQNVPKDDKPPTASVDAAISTDDEAEPSLDPWLAKQADALLDVVGCYLDKTSLAKEVALETAKDKNSIRLIEIRIKLLKTMASHNAASHCK